MQIRENISLRPYNSFAVDARAKYFSTVKTTQDLREILQQSPAREPLLVLGGGSNVLFVKDWEGLVVKNEIGGIEVVKEDEQHVYVRAGAGVNWNTLVMHCVDNGYAGMENLSLIPGNVGASPLQNIGAYGVEIKDIFYELEAIHIKDGTTQRFAKDDCEFGYRESVFKRRYKGKFVITNVTYRLDRTPTFHTSYGAIEQELERMGVKDLSIKAVSQAVVNIRSSKLPDPTNIGNAGSFFKNPHVEEKRYAELRNCYPGMPSFPVDERHVKIPAGWLIEQAGWKGYRKGDAGCYEKQALVLVNYGGATGNEIYALSEEILQSVQKKFGILLEREVNVL